MHCQYRVCFGLSAFSDDIDERRGAVPRSVVPARGIRCPARTRVTWRRSAVCFRSNSSRGVNRPAGIRRREVGEQSSDLSSLPVGWLREVPLAAGRVCHRRAASAHLCAVDCGVQSCRISAYRISEHDVDSRYLSCGQLSVSAIAAPPSAVAQFGCTPLCTAGAVIGLTYWSSWCLPCCDRCQ